MENLLSNHSQLVYSKMKIKKVSPLFCAPVFLGAVMCVRKLNNVYKKYEEISEACQIPTRWFTPF